MDIMFQSQSPAASPPAPQPLQLAEGSIPPRKVGSNAHLIPHTSFPDPEARAPADNYSHTHVTGYIPDTTRAVYFDTIWAPQRLQALKARCKRASDRLVWALKRLTLRERHSENITNAATLTTARLNKTIPSTDRNPDQSSCSRRCIVDRAAMHNAIPEARDNTWKSPINIFYASSPSESDVLRSAIGRFDSQSGIDLMSSTFAARSLGLYFEKPIRKLVGITLTGEEIYSIGEVIARWASVQDVTLSSSSGCKITLPAKSHYTTFHVVVSNHFDIIIGHPSLLENGLYGEKPKLLNPFRSPTNTSTQAQDQEYLKRMEAERLAVAQITKQQPSAEVGLLADQYELCPLKIFTLV